MGPTGRELAGGGSGLHDPAVQGARGPSAGTGDGRLCASMAVTPKFDCSVRLYARSSIPRNRHVEIGLIDEQDLVGRALGRVPAAGCWPGEGRASAGAPVQGSPDAGDRRASVSTLREPPGDQGNETRLWNPNYRRFFIARTTSQLGDQMLPIAITAALVHTRYGMSGVGY